MSVLQEKFPKRRCTFFCSHVRIVRRNRFDCSLRIHKDVQCRLKIGRWVLFRRGDTCKDSLYAKDTSPHPLCDEYSFEILSCSIAGTKSDIVATNSYRDLCINSVCFYLKVLSNPLFYQQHRELCLPQLHR